jgi:peptide deformylase
MSKYSIVLYPKDILYQKCLEITEFNEELVELLEEMKVIMLNNNGMGLAANQVGALKSVFIMLDLKTKEVVEFINPRVLEVGVNISIEPEMCLSAPGAVVSVPRATEVYLEAQRRNGEPFKAVLSDLEARCALHELDHLQGKFYLDLVNRQQRKAALKKLNLK